MASLEQEFPSGLSTTEAVTRLHRELSITLDDYLISNRKKLWQNIFKEAWSHKSFTSVFRWPAILEVLLASTALLVAGNCDPEQPKFKGLREAAIILIFVATLNACIVLWEAYLKHFEVPQLIRNFLSTLQDSIDTLNWTADDYPSIYMPLTPCITLQWTIREGMKVNLPAALLVAGDVVLMRPGQKVLADCVPYVGNASTFSSSTQKQYAHSIYSPALESTTGEALTSPKARVPSLPKPFILTETPYLRSLKLILDEACNRPVTVYQRQRSALATVLERYAIPFFFFSACIICSARLHYGFWWSDEYLQYARGHTASHFNETNASGYRNSSTHSCLWPEVWLSVPVSVVLPLLPLMLPTVWTLVTVITTSFILCLHHSLTTDSNTEQHTEVTTPSSSDCMTSEGEDAHPDASDSDHLCPPPRAGAGGVAGARGVSNSSMGPLRCTGLVSWSDVLQQAIKVVTGDPPSCIRSSNFAQVLASVTNLCCVDKKGVLSWANPTPEKIFFLCKRPKMAADVTINSTEDANKETETAAYVSASQEPTDSLAQNEGNMRQFAENSPVSESEAVAPNNTTDDKTAPGNRDGNTRSSSAESLVVPDDEVFSAPVSHSDMTYESEPVLLSLTHTHATPFALSFDDPVWRKSLGSLKPLGLSVLLNTCNPATQSHYSTFWGHVTNEASYTKDLVPVSQRRCLCELARQIGFSSAAHSPFSLEHQLSVYRHIPSEFSVCRRGRYSRSLLDTKLKFPFPHMLSVLMRDHSTHKLELLTQGTADIVLDSCSDFWDGTDLRPLTEKDRKKLLDFYHRTSLSAYCTAFSYRPSPCVVNADLTNQYMELPSDPSHLYTRSPTPHNSTEALFGDEAHSEYEVIEDIDDLFRMQSKQIFVGMVTMQYQAKPDMVHLLEQLDGACIRFIHFSKENELRSRVFSEKMGLESGWNCHISLLDNPKAEDGCSSRGGGAVGGTASGLSLCKSSVEDMSRCASSTATSALPSRIKHSFRSKSLRRKYVRGGRSLLDTNRALSHSAPSTINLESSIVKFDDEVSICSSASSEARRGDRGNAANGSNLPPTAPHSNCSPCPPYSPRHRPYPPSSTSSHSPQLILKHSLHYSPPLSAHGSTTHMSHQNKLSSTTESAADQPQTTVTIQSDTEIEEEEDESELNDPPSSQSSDSSTCFNFDMSNRARLPKGIANIRPHLRDVDNVPLLVSLFTDCTTAATRQMLAIMQENNEVLLLLGSSSNLENVELCVNTDASIGVEPLYPVVCIQQTEGSSHLHSTDGVPGKRHNGPPNSFTPTSLAGCLYTLPCILNFSNKHTLTLVSLVERARHLIQTTCNSLQFWASCSLSIALLQLLTLLALLPPLMHPLDMLWMDCFVVPLLSLALACAPHNAEVMALPTGKNTLSIDRHLLRYITSHYGSKFLPSIIVVIVVYFLTLRDDCLSSLPSGAPTLGSPYPIDDVLLMDPVTSVSYNLANNTISNTNNGTAPEIPPVLMVECYYVYHLHYRDQPGTVFSDWGANSPKLLRGFQAMAGSLLFFYLCIISVSFVHRMSHVWRKNPFINKIWTLTVPIVMAMQVTYCACVCSAYEQSCLSSVPLEAWIVASIWALLLLPTNELLKIREIRANVRYQKKARLEFGTKLGMNSPF